MLPSNVDQSRYLVRMLPMLPNGTVLCSYLTYIGHLFRKPPLDWAACPWWAVRQAWPHLNPEIRKETANLNGWTMTETCVDFDLDYRDRYIYTHNGSAHTTCTHTHAHTHTDVSLVLKGPIACQFHFMRFSNNNMSTPSLPMVPQWLEMTLGVKQALGISAFEKKQLSDVPIWNLAPFVIIRGQVTSPFSAFPAQRIWPANETMSYDRACATCVCV